MRLSKRLTFIVFVSAISSFAGTCEHPCETAQSLRSQAETLSDNLYQAQAGRNLTDQQCGKIMSAASSLAEKGRLNDVKDWSCDSDRGSKRKDLCSHARSIRPIAQNIKAQVELICGSTSPRSRGGTLDEYATDPNSRLLKKYFKESVDLVDGQLMAEGAPVTLAACGQKEADKHAQSRPPRIMPKAPQAEASSAAEPVAANVANKETGGCRQTANANGYSVIECWGTMAKAVSTPPGRPEWAGQPTDAKSKPANDTTGPSGSDQPATGTAGGAGI